MCARKFFLPVGRWSGAAMGVALTWDWRIGLTFVLSILEARGLYVELFYFPRDRLACLRFNIV